VEGSNSKIDRLGVQLKQAVAGGMELDLDGLEVFRASFDACRLEAVRLLAAAGLGDKQLKSIFDNGGVLGCKVKDRREHRYLVTGQFT
jgi:hypothetical protein